MSTIRPGEKQMTAMWLMGNRLMRISSAVWIYPLTKTVCWLRICLAEFYIMSTWNITPLFETQFTSHCLYMCITSETIYYTVWSTFPPEVWQTVQVLAEKKIDHAAVYLSSSVFCGVAVAVIWTITTAWVRRKGDFVCWRQSWRICLTCYGFLVHHFTKSHIC